MKRAICIFFLRNAAEDQKLSKSILSIIARTISTCIMKKNLLRQNFPHSEGAKFAISFRKNVSMCYL